MPFWSTPIAAGLLIVSSFAHAAAPLAQPYIDPPRDKAHPAAMVYVRIPSQEALMNGVLYTAAKGGLHPAVVLLHGLPGNEQNLDLAQSMRRTGFDVLTFHYRGSWGSPGAFSFVHAIEDAEAAVAFLHSAEVAAKYGIDTRRIYLVGHSMGGFLTAVAAAHEPNVAGLVMISPWDISADGRKFTDPDFRKAAVEQELNDDVIPLAGTTVDKLMDEALSHAAGWDFTRDGSVLCPRPVLLITADDDTYAGGHRLAQTLRGQCGNTVTEHHFITDHSYSDHRIALESVVVDWLERTDTAVRGRISH